jgi:hypothetical protein
MLYLKMLKFTSVAWSIILKTSGDFLLVKLYTACKDIHVKCLSQPQLHFPITSVRKRFAALLRVINYQRAGKPFSVDVVILEEKMSCLCLYIKRQWQ